MPGNFLAAASPEDYTLPMEERKSVSAYRAVMGKLEETGRYFAFLGEIARQAVKPPYRLYLLVEQLECIGVNSVFIIFLSSLAIGMIFALQMVTHLQPFQAEIGTGAAVGMSLGREFAPVITSLMLIAKDGSAMAAELGTMRVTEQIDALESMSVNVTQYLVLPRVVASILAFPALTLLANVIGVAGAYFISTGLYGIDKASYLHFMFTVMSVKDVYSGLIKAALMGFVVSSVCCNVGLSSSGGAKGVGVGATKAVVISSVAILVGDYLLTTLMMVTIFK